MEPPRAISPCPDEAPACSAGAELPAGLAVPQEVEDHHPGLHQVPPRRQHAQEEPGGVQHAGGRGRVRAAAAHPGQQLPAAPADGSQLQEAPHHARRCQQHLPQQVGASLGASSEGTGQGRLGRLGAPRDGCWGAPRSLQQGFGPCRAWVGVCWGGVCSDGAGRGWKGPAGHRGRRQRGCMWQGAGTAWCSNRSHRAGLGDEVHWAGM